MGWGGGAYQYDCNKKTQQVIKSTDIGEWGWGPEP